MPRKIDKQVEGQVSFFGEQKPARPTTVARRDRTDEYWNIFESMIDAIGKIKKYEGLAFNYGYNPDVTKVVDDRSKTLAEYRSEASKNEDNSIVQLTKFMQLCNELQLEFPFGAKEWYHSLFDADKRKHARSTMNAARKKHAILSPSEIDAKYANLLEKRRKKHR